MESLVASNAKRLGQLQQHLGYCLALEDGLDEEEDEPSQPATCAPAGGGEDAIESSLLQEALHLVTCGVSAVQRLGTQQQRRLQKFLQHALSPARLMEAAYASAVT